MASEREIRARGDLPRHVAVIMDGNGRWARRQRRPRIVGHREGMKSVRAVIEAAADLGIPWLTLFAFSQENWKRPRAEVEALMTLLRRYIDSERDELVEKGIRVTAIGELDRLEPSVRRELDRLIEATADGGALTVTLALSYGGRTEIVEAARRIAGEAAAGRLDPAGLDEAAFARFLYTADMPDPDLLIRTSGEMRISNFLLWQIAYTELYVTDILWPDFGRQAFLDAIAAYQERERRFGAVLV
ncbi:MAG TPA: isoprenyl transferase [Gemmatimonadota bacterium]|nr:isoprenyl transferase [Gemmatimonadota bacterium]